MFLAATAFAQQDQKPRGPAKDSRGLLTVNQEMFEIAAATGGDFYFWAPGEFATSNLHVPIHHRDVILAYGALDGKRQFEIPVETGVGELTVFAGIQRKDLAALLRPDGIVAHDGESGVALQSYQHMTIASVNSPAPGLWKLELHGVGTFAVTAHVKGDQDIGEFDPKTCTVAAAVGELFFVARDGTTIGKVPVEPCSLPSIPYRVVMRGVDRNGMVFQRIESQLRTP